MDKAKVLRLKQTKENMIRLNKQILSTERKLMVLLIIHFLTLGQILVKMRKIGFIESRHLVIFENNDPTTCNFINSFISYLIA